MANDAGGGTSGAKKKIPDDPYFDSSSPAGSNFKKTTSSVKSNGFQNSQLDDPYFSNTSPAGSTMSSDKSTWRNTNSGWNVPPSGGTAAQGGGSTATRRSPSDDPYYDDRSPAGSTFESQRDRRSSGSTVRRDENQYDGPMPTRDRGSEFVSTAQSGPLVRLTNDLGTETWSPSTVRNGEASVQFSSPAWNWVANKAQQGIDYLNQVQEDYENSGIKRSHDVRAAERDEWYQEQVDKGGWRGGLAAVGATIAAGFQAAEMVQDATLAQDMPEAPWDRQQRQVAELMGQPTTPQATPVTLGQALSAAGEATNRKFNVLSSDFEGPLPSPQRSEYSSLPKPSKEWSGDWFNIFTNSIEDSRAVNEQFMSLNPADQYLASPVFNMLHSSGPKAQQDALTTVLTQTDTVLQLRKQAESALATGDMLGAASYNLAADNLAAKSSLDIVEENKNWAGDLMAKLAVPDPLDFFAGPAVDAGRASVQRVKAMLASPITEASVEAATEMLQTAIAGADELAALADSSGDLFRFWKGQKNAVQKLFENTRATEAERVAANLSDSLAVVLPRAKTADEAKVLIRELLDGTLFEKQPDIGRNPFLDPQFLEDLPVIKKAENLIINAKTLNDPEGYNPLLVLGEIEDMVWRKSRQLFGLDNATLPTGTVRMKTVKQGEKYVVQWLGADDTVLKSTDTDAPFSWKEAKAIYDEQTAFIKEGLSKPWYMRVGDWQRAVLSTMYLNLAPRHWIRNAIAAYSAMTVDDALNITKLDNIAEHVTKLYGGGAPSTEFGNVFRGMQVNPTAPETGTKGFWTFGGKWSKYNPIAWVDNAGSKIWTSTTEVPIGGGKAIPIGEEAFRIRIAYQRMMQYLDHGVDALTDDFSAGLRDLGLAPELVSSYVGRFSDLARSTNRTQIFETMRDVIGTAELAASLDEIGIHATQTTPQGRAALMEILNESSLDDLGTLQGRLMGWLKQETQSLSDILSQVQPQPGRKFFTTLSMSQDAADGIENLTYAATKGGMDPAEARQAAEQLWQGVVDNEQQALQAVQDLIVSTADNDAFDRAFLFFRKLEDEKRNIRLTVDRLNKKAAQSARENKNIWEATRTQVTELWQNYANNVQTWLDDISNATVAPRNVTEAFGVGEIVRLNDGTEVTIKQVLTENDVTSYVVTPRVQQAAQAAPQPQQVAPAAVQAVEASPVATQQTAQAVSESDIKFTRTSKGGFQATYTYEAPNGDVHVIDQLGNSFRVYVRENGGLPADASKITWRPTLRRAKAIVVEKVTGVERGPYTAAGRTRTTAAPPTAPRAQQAAQAAPAPTFVERTINAADIVPPAGSTSDVAARAQSATDDILQRYMAFDAEDNARLRAMGISPGSDDITWSKVINAGRDYVDQALNDALLFFRRAPSQDFFDHLVSAEKEVNETGMWVAARVARLRDEFLGGNMGRADYYQQSSELWSQFWEFGHQRFRFATNAGLRASLGDDAAAALAALPTYHVPPTPTMDDIKRMASLVGRATDKGDKRLLNSINSHLNLGLAKLDDMTPDQRRQVFQYYISEAQANGVDIPNEWYRWRNPDTSRVTGFGVDDDFAQTMWKLESGRLATGNVQTPTYGDVAQYELANAWDVVQKVMDNAERLLTPRPNNLTNQQKAGAVRLLNKMLRQWEDVLYNSAKAGEEATAFAMLNYRDRKNIDTFLSAIFPYHYYATRAPANWLRRTIERPSIAYNVWLANQAIRGENEQFDGPMRADGSIPNPFANLATNIGAPGLGDALPNRIYSPLEYAIPYSIWNDFINPAEGQSRFERAYLNVQKFTPGFQPLIQVAGASLFDVFSPRKEDQWSRMSQYELGDYLPIGRMAGYLAQGLSGNKIWGQLGDTFDYGRIGRVIDNGIAAGDYDPYYGNLAKGQIENQMRGYAPIPELQEPKTAAEVRKIAENATSLAGWERFKNLAMGYFFGVPGQNVDDIEREMAQFQQEYYGLGYGYDNTMGSKAAQQAFRDEKLSSGVTYGEATPRNYSSLYSPVGSEYGPLTEQAVTRKFNEERSAIYDNMSKATIDFLLDNPTATNQEMSDFKQQFYTQIEELKAKYPSAQTEGDSRYAANLRGANPFEAAQIEMENVLRYEPPGKPAYPPEGAPAAAMNDYYTQLGEWREKQLNVIERVFEQWAQGDDTQPGKADADYVGQRTVIGRYAQELLDTYELRYASPVEIEWYMRNQLRSETTSGAYRQRQETLTQQFGEDGFALFSEFQAIPEGEGNNYWTPAHDKFIEENPEIQEMLIYDRSPEVHDHMLGMGGERVFEALAMYPGGGTKQEKKQWKAKYSRQKDAVYWYFGVNDNLRSSVSAAYDEADMIAADPWAYSGPRPVGSGREPIGGITRDAYMQAADPYFTDDYTLDRPRDAVAKAQVNAQSKDAQFGGYDNYLATVYPPLADSMAQGQPQYALRRPGLTSPPAGSAAELKAARTAADAGKLMEYLDAVKAAQADSEPTRTASSGGGGGYGGYRYRGRYYRRRSRRGYRRRGSRRRGGYRRYSRGGGGRRYGGYGGGGGGSTVDEGQELFLNTNNPPRIYAREFASWLMPSSSSRDVWRPTGASTGMRQPQQPSIRPWRRINVRA